ncbi:hypothetical protein Agub_g7318, partial [Astrephomene gubernaculifera]
MSSLFGNLFGGENGSGGIFSPSSKFKAAEQPAPAQVVEPSNAVKSEKQGKQRKEKAAGDAAADEHGNTAAAKTRPSKVNDVKKASGNATAADSGHGKKPRPDLQPAEAKSDAPGKGKKGKRVAAADGAAQAPLTEAAPEATRPGKKQKSTAQAEPAKPGKAAAAAARTGRALQDSLEASAPAATAAAPKAKGKAAVAPKKAAAAGAAAAKEAAKKPAKRKAPEPPKPASDDDDEEHADLDSDGSDSQDEDQGDAAAAAAGDEDEEDASGDEEDGSDAGDLGSEDEEAADTDAATAAPAAGSEPPAKKRRLSPEEEAAKLARTIFVGNLPASMATGRTKQIRRQFEGFGEVESVRVRAVPVKMDAKMPRRNAILSGNVDSERGAPCTAYVVFREPAAARAALGANMQLVEGHHIRVDMAAPPKNKKDAGAAAGAGAAAKKKEDEAGSMFDPARSVFVGNLSFQTSDEELIGFMLGHARSHPELADAVEAVRVVRDRETSVGKGFAFVLFKTKAAVHAALNLNGKPLQKRPLRIIKSSRYAAAGGGSAASGRGGRGAGRGGGIAGRGAGRSGSRGAVASDPSSWQGAKTQGKVKALRGPKPARVGKAAPGGAPGSGEAPASRSRPEKRPAVAARKAAAATGVVGGVVKRESARAAAAAPGARREWSE